jgi:hypothetical protein
MATVSRQEAKAFREAPTENKTPVGNNFVDIIA